MSPQIEAFDIAMVDPGSGYSLFNETIEAIQSTVLEEHRRDFQYHTNASLFLDELRTLSVTNGIGSPRLQECCHKFGFFTHLFAPYFDVLGTCVQIGSDWVGYFWATVRLVFKVGSDYTVMLEKIADMLEAVAHILPPYQRLYETCERKTFSLEAPTEDSRLAALLSYVYADFIRLFLDLYRIFCRVSQGSKSRHLTLDSTQSAQWRPLDSRFARLEARIVRHKRWLEKEIDNQIQNHTEIAQHRNDCLAFLDREPGLNRDNNGGLEDRRIAKRMRRVDNVKFWLSNCSSPVEVHEGGAQQQCSNSCVWFLETPAYRNWKHVPFDRSKANDANALENTWQHRVLFVQAKPGFGKTFISHSVISDLMAEVEDLDMNDESSSTAFFHFQHGGHEDINPEYAFRALAVQLMQKHCHNHSTLDAICLLMRKTSCREKATTDEVLDVISLLLRQHPTFLVIDGVDGGNIVEAFLKLLSRICRISDAKVIIFSRPNINIPLEYQKWASDAPHILSLTAEHNASAIERYVAQDLILMADQGFFGISIDRTLMSQVARAASGEFLWAGVMLKFLWSAALSSDERRAILENIQLLEGLGALYRNILGALERRPKLEKRIIADAFRWLSFSINPLSPSALRSAISTPEISTTEEFCPTDVLEALPELACGLIDVKKTTIAFTHGSIHEYLQSPSLQGSEFSLYDENNAHAHLASRCLSYLAHDLPKRPLGALSPRIRPVLPTIPTTSGASLRTSKSGDSGYKSMSSSNSGSNLTQPAVHNNDNNEADTGSVRMIPFDTNLPFLRYASLCWPIHLSRALSDYNTLPNFTSWPGSHATIPYLDTLRAFLTSRLAVTAWVEASFRYNLPPTLTRLVGPLSDLTGDISPATVAGNELRLVVGEIRELSERLVELKREHMESMMENPSLIWRMDDGYWPQWN